MRWDGEYDVVVIGSGIAGLSAALASVEHGLRPLVVEKADRLGGSTTYSYGLIWIGCNHLAEAAGYADNRDHVIQYMRFLGGGQHSEGRIRTFAQRSPEAIVFYEKCGIRFRIVKGVKDFYFGRGPGTTSEGRTIEHIPISGAELGEWADRITLPVTPYRLSGEELVAWGGMHNFASDGVFRIVRKSDPLSNYLAGQAARADVPQASVMSSATRSAPASNRRRIHCPPPW